METGTSPPPLGKPSEPALPGLFPWGEGLPPGGLDLGQRLCPRAHEVALANKPAPHQPLVPIHAPPPTPESGALPGNVPSAEDCPGGARAQGRSFLVPGRGFSSGCRNASSPPVNTHHPAQGCSRPGLQASRARTRSGSAGRQ